MMNQSVEVLFKLIRIALGNEDDFSLPNVVNWQEVYELSLKQEVGAIACDGLLTLRDCGIDELLKYKWVGQSMVIERKSEKQWCSVCQLADLYAQHGVRTNVLKGFSFADYYPHPFHRPSSDIDICLLDDFEKGNQIVEKMGVVVDRSENVHSTFYFEEVHVENHQFCVRIKGSNRYKQMELYLERLLRDGGVCIGTTSLIKPSWLFNALFFMCHARVHFLIEEGITLKYLCDWILLKAEGVKEKNIDIFWLECEKSGLLKFAKAIDEVAEYVKGCNILSESGQLMVQDIIHTKTHKQCNNKVKAYLNILKTIWNNRWKYNLYSDITAVRAIMIYVYGYMFDRNPQI